MRARESWDPGGQLDSLRRQFQDQSPEAINNDTALKKKKCPRRTLAASISLSSTSLADFLFIAPSANRSSLILIHPSLPSLLALSAPYPASAFNVNLLSAPELNGTGDQRGPASSLTRLMASAFSRGSLATGATRTRLPWMGDEGSDRSMICVIRIEPFGGVKGFCCAKALAAATRGVRRLSSVLPPRRCALPVD